MKISEKQIMELIRIADAVVSYENTGEDTQKMIGNLLNSIKNQQSDELKEVTDEN